MEENKKEVTLGQVANVVSGIASLGTAIYLLTHPKKYGKVVGRFTGKAVEYGETFAEAAEEEYQAYEASKEARKRFEAEKLQEKLDVLKKED